MVKSRLKTCGETNCVVGNRKLNAHQQSFDAGDDKENQSIADIHQSDFLVIDRRHPIMQDVERSRVPAAVRSTSGVA